MSSIFGIMSQNIDIILTFGKEVPRSTHIFTTERGINDYVMITYAVIIYAETRCIMGYSIVVWAWALTACKGERQSMLS